MCFIWCFFFPTGGFYNSFIKELFYQKILILAYSNIEDPDLPAHDVQANLGLLCRPTIVSENWKENHMLYKSIWAEVYAILGPGCLWLSVCAFFSMCLQTVYRDSLANIWKSEQILALESWFCAVIMITHWCFKRCFISF